MKYAVVNASASGSNTVVAAVANKRILVLQYMLTASTNIYVKFQSATTDLTGPLHLPNHGDVSASYGASTPAGLVGLFVTNIGEALTLDLSGAHQVGGHITYLVTD